MKTYTPENPVFSDKFNIIERADLVNSRNHNLSVMQLMDNEVALKNQLDSCLGSTEGDKLQFADGINADNVVDAVNEVFRLGSETKSKLAENLTAIGIASSAGETWEQLLGKVLDLTDTSKDTITADALLSGYTAHNAAGSKITGTLADKTGTADHGTEASLDTANKWLKLKVPAVAKYDIGNYLYATYNTVASLIGLTAAKLVKGYSILGITGNSNNMDTSGANAAAGDILSGKKAGVKGSLITGTMANKDAWTGATTGNGNVVIPAGYHNGSGYVSGAGAYNKGVSDADGRPNVNSANYKAGYNQGYEAGKSAGGSCTILRCNAGILEGNTTSHRSDFNADCTGKSRVEFDYCGYANSASLQLDVYVGNNFNNDANADWYGNPWDWSDATKIATIDASGNSVRHASINIPNGKKWLSFYITNNHDQYAGVEIRNLKMT